MLLLMGENKTLRSLKRISIVSILLFTTTAIIYGCSTTYSSTSPSDFWWYSRPYPNDNSDLAHIPFGDIRQLSIKNIIKSYSSAELNSWSLKGDPIAAYALANEELGIEYADELAGIDISEHAADYYYIAATGGCQNTSNIKAREFLNCEYGLPEAKYAMGLFCNNNIDNSKYCSVRSQEWFRQSASEGFYPAAAMIR